MKEELEQIKQELNTQEKFFESFFKIERFIKKYKTQLILIVVAIVIIVAGVNINSYLQEQKLIKSNIAYNNILQNKDIEKNLNILKENSPTLYKIALYKTGKRDTINLQYLKEITILQKGIKNNDLKAIDSVILSSDLLLKNYALFYKAVLLVDKKEYKKAKRALELIPKDSKVYQLANSLNHFLLTHK